MMRRHSDPFCVVCTEQWLKAIYKRSKIADGFSPAFQRPEPPLVWDAGETRTFRAHVLRRDDIKTTWRIKKLEQKRWRRRQITHDYRSFTISLPANKVAGVTIPTAWAVECLLEDATTRIRTPSIRSRSKQKHRWYVIVK
jgi:hypothetical protein